jgi:hypothetical protein
VNNFSICKLFAGPTWEVHNVNVAQKSKAALASLEGQLYFLDEKIVTLPFKNTKHLLKKNPLSSP